MKYRKKPVVIEAIKWDGENFKEVVDFTGGNLTYLKPYDDQPISIRIHTLEGDMFCSIGDFIIKGVKGEFYPCKPDIFEATYEVNEKWKRDIGEPLRWIRLVKVGVNDRNTCPNCKVNRAKATNYCPSCGVRLLPPEEDNND